MECHGRLVPLYVEIAPTEIEDRIASSHETVRSIYWYWQDKRGDRRMPARRDIDPIDLRFHLPRIILVDVVSDDRRFVYRLVGTQEVAGRGYDPTGRSVGEAFYAESQEAALASYEYVVRERRPFCFKDPYVTRDGWHEHEDTIYLPLSEDGMNVTMILVYSFSYDFRPRMDNPFMLK